MQLGKAFTICLCLVSVALPQSLSEYTAAASYVRQGQPQAAIPVLNKILSASPADLKARNLLGIALMSSGRRAEANVQFQKAIRQDPRFHPALKNLGVNEFEMGLKKDAKLHFEQALKLVPNDAVVHFHLGQLYFDEARYADAAAQLESAKDQFPVQSLLSRAYAKSGRMQQAYDTLRAAIQLHPQDETNYLDLMALCLDLQNWDLSLEISAVALDRLPQSYMIRLERGAVFAMQGKLEDAESEFAAAVKAAPNVNLPYVTLALARREMGKLAEAIQLLRDRRALDSKDYLVNWILADALIREGSGDEKEAGQALEDAIRVKPAAVQARKLLAELLVKRGDLPRAAREFEAVLKIDPNDTSAAYQLAMLYRKTGDSKRAEELFAKVGKARAEDPPPMAPANLIQIIRDGSK